MSQAQPPHPTRPEFEVASIKPNKSRGGFTYTFEGGRFTATRTSLLLLIKAAWQVKNYQVSGSPAWLSSEVFDIVAKAPPERARDGFVQAMPMLQALLADRFKLATHRETKVVQGYALVIAKAAPKLRQSAYQDEYIGGGRGEIAARHLSAARLADELSLTMDSPVVDSTGLEGFFDFELHWTPEGQPIAGNEGPSIFTALPEQLGLKLEARKVPVEILVIDHVERVPSEN